MSPWSISGSVSGYALRGFRSRVEGFRVYDSKWDRPQACKQDFRVEGLGFRVYGLGFRV
jgi:hypothetical protein